MCGIFGGHSNLLIENTEAVLYHRGPDQQGRETFTDGRGAPLVMGMTRLSIVDRREMPIPFSARGACIVFNGEIYNWREIKSKLQQVGVNFQTETDTEVVLHAYLEWGATCLDRFNGMFAFAIWRNNELFLARDRMGKKPLFYFVEGEELAFASELKGFSRLEFVEQDLCERLEFYFDEYTPFRNVKSLKPGEYMIYDTTVRQARLFTWWKYPDYQGTISDMKTAVSEFLVLFEDACRIRKLADVPVTLFLSGGIDSSLIQALLRFDTTYTIQFPEFKETINEQDLVQEYAEFLGFEARFISPTREQFLDVFPYLARYIEFPVGSFSIFPLFCLARQARADGFKVALSGEGADEFFNGYYRNEMLLEEDTFVDAYVTSPYKHLATRYFGSHLERACRMASRTGISDVGLLMKTFQPLWNDASPFAHNLSVLESSVFLQALLIMADRMSMGNGLEVRNPFMDYRVIEFSTKLVPELRYHNGRGKYVLREALKEVLGTDRLGITRRIVKHGLPSPVNAWLFRRNNFERKDWNRIMLGECLRQLTMRGI